MSYALEVEYIDIKKKKNGHKPSPRVANHNFNTVTKSGSLLVHSE